MQTEFYISRIETDWIEIPTTVDEVLLMKEQLLNDLIAEYSFASTQDSYTMTPSTPL